MLPYGRKNPLPFLYFEAVTVSGLRQTNKQRETGVKRVETAGVYPLVAAAQPPQFPARRQRRFPRFASATLTT